MWWWVSAAMAGSGPWTVGAGRGTVFVGVDGQRFGHLATGTGDERTVAEVGEGVQKVTAKGIATVGLSSRVELEVGVPWSRAETTRPDAELCGALGLGACETTQGIGVVDARAKVLVLDEYFNAPVSLALAGEVRFGQLTADDRERITNLGEGTLDVGPQLALGRTGSVGQQGYFSAWVQGGYRFRSRNTNDYPLADPKKNAAAPKDEVVAALQVLVSPDGRIGFGPDASFLYRDGLRFDQLDLSDVDRFAALGVANLRLGGTAVLRASDQLCGVVNVLGTAFAQNNPTDSWSVSVGVQWAADLPGGER